MMASPYEVHAMRQAIALSALGLGSTSPNPPVGCVILDSDGQVAGAGYHQRKGEPHAEPQALKAAGSRAHGGTAVVTLEPCNHVGLTPACRQAILDAQIARVIIAIIDPTSRGEGGAAMLKESGVDVEVGVLAEEAQNVLGPWITATLRRRPFVTWARIWGNPTTMSIPACVRDLRRQADVVLYADGRVEEGLPGGHGAGMLQLPTGPLDPAALAALYGGGVRTVLAAGESPLARSLLAHEAVDRIVIELTWEGVPDDVAFPLPSGYELEAVTTTRTAVQVTANRRDSH